MERRVQTESEMQMLGEELAKVLKKGLICLYGDLGVGKTTFVRGLARGLKIQSRIQSPTFTYQRVHRGEVTLYHFDCYRLNDRPDTLLLADVSEALEKNDGVVVIEWAEKIAEVLPKNRTDIYFDYDGAGRTIRIV